MADVTLRNIKEAVPETVIIRGVSGAFGVTHIRYLYLAGSFHYIVEVDRPRNNLNVTG
jgi:hypothetical protein